MSGDLEYQNCDHEAARLLPWFVTGALSAEETVRVQAHLQQCSLCTADEQRELRVRALVGNHPAIEHAPQPGLQKLMSRIDELERELPAPAVATKQSAAPLQLRPAFVRWLAAAVVVQAIGLGVLGALLWQQNSRFQAPLFSTLSSPAPQIGNAPHIRVVFAPAMTVDEMQTLLASIPATVAAGPSGAGVYTLVLTDKQKSVDAVLAQLRADNRVLFAEPQLLLEQKP